MREKSGRQSGLAAFTAFLTYLHVFPVLPDIPDFLRRRNMRGGVLKVFLVLIILPILVGGAVALTAGRPIAFEVLKRRTAARFPEVKWITGDELARWQADTGQPQPVILDARTEPEFALSHIRGAVRIDPYRPSLRALDVPLSSAIVVYSSAGYRGARVTSWLGKQGYTSVTNLAGGIFQWVNRDRPVFREEGRPTALVHPYDRRWGYLVERRFRAQAPDLPKQSAAP
jgi:rhodanese-related sulfurtransferase